MVGGVQRALEKRPVSADAIELAISTIKSQLRATGEREVPKARWLVILLWVGESIG